MPGALTQIMMHQVIANLLFFNIVNSGKKQI